MDKTILENNRQWIEKTWEKIDKKLQHTAKKSRNKIPYTTIDGVHDNKVETGPDWWTNGFWGAMMWLMWDQTGNEEYKITAQEAEKLLDKAFLDIAKLHHDVGFMWHITSGASYRLTGDMQSKNREALAAALLASRYNPDGGFIRAWNGDDAKGWSIIDCMMNIPLLYFMAKELNIPRYYKIAINHARMAVRDHIRPDGSVNHIVEHDMDTGEVVKIYGGQGYNETSCWSRGLAWAVYGCVLSYIHTNEKEFLDAAIKTANFFIANAKMTDYRPPADFRAPAEPAYYDSTAGVCTACALLELSKYVSETEGALYTNEAINLLKAADKYFCDYSENEDALVLMGTERYPNESMSGVHIPIIYGDFFFVEAMTKLRGSDFLIW